MKKYSDYQNNIMTKFKIIVPTDNDKKLLMEAFEHIHYSNIDTDIVTVNQLAHQYQPTNQIIVDENLYKTLP